MGEKCSTEQEFVIEDDAPGAAPLPGIALSDLFRFGKVIELVIKAFKGGAPVSFFVKVLGLRWEVIIRPAPAA